MYNIPKFCCICISNYKNLNTIHPSNPEILDKLKYCVPEVVFNTEIFTLYICTECCEKLHETFIFKEMCIKNHSVIEGYVTQFQENCEHYEEDDSAVLIPLIDMKVEENSNSGIYIKIETQTDLETDNKQMPERSFEFGTDNLKNEMVFVKNDPKTVENEHNLHEHVSKTSILSHNSNKFDFKVTNNNRLCNYDKPTNQNYDCDQTTNQRKDYEQRTNHSQDNNPTNGRRVYDSQTTNQSSNYPRPTNKKALNNLNRPIKAVYSNNDPLELYKCTICLQIFETDSELTSHFNSDSCKKSHKCFICNKIFPRNVLNKHMLTHRKDTNFECEICKKRFLQKSSLEAHIIIHNEVNNDNKCSFCGKLFVSRSKLSRHVVTHTNERKYKCEICFKFFTCKSNRDKHLVIHKGTRPHKCDICNSGFTQKIALIKHMVVHTKERNFECTICQKKFALKSHLDRHLWTHKDIKPFNCQICDKGFTDRRCLNRHMFRHSSGM